MDCLIRIEDKPFLIREVKAADDTPSPHFSTFNKYFPDIPKPQLVKTGTRKRLWLGDLWIRKLSYWLTNIDMKVFKN